MPQHDYVIDSQGMPAARADINNALQALASTNKGPSAPSTPYAGELWIDDSVDPSWTLKLYDGSDWVTVGTIDTTSDTFTPAGGAGGITTGTTLVQNPYANNATVTQAHGLGAEPDLPLEVVLECLTAEFGYSVGHRVRLSAAHPGTSGTVAFTARADGTNVVLETHSTEEPVITRADNNNSSGITAANWKLEITPFKRS